MPNPTWAKAYEKALDESVNDFKAKVTLEGAEPLQRIHVDWSIQSRAIGWMEATVNTDTGLAYFTGMEIVPEFQQSGLYAAAMAVTIEQFPKTGLKKLAATPASHLAAYAFQSGGFVFDQGFNTFTADLENPNGRPRQFLNWRKNGGDEPQWRKDLTPPPASG